MEEVKMENTLSKVRYVDWDALRGLLYDEFGWYMENIHTIQRTADILDITPDVLMQRIRKKAIENMENVVSNIKRGDEL